MRLRTGVRPVRVYYRQEVNLTVLSPLAENEVGIGRDGEMVGDEFLLERVLELESLSIPDLHRFVEIATCTHKNTPVGGV